MIPSAPKQSAARYNPGVDLFAASRKSNRDAAAPLAVRMRPRTLDEVVGQGHFLGPGKLLRRMLEADRLSSVLFYGPPGTGKTTLAEVIAGHTGAHFDSLNAASANVKEVRAVLDAARERLETAGRRTVLFLDEIHRFNRAQQDVLLNDVEVGTITLIGATTENPFFAVNSALVSRSQIFQFAPLTEGEVKELIRRAAADEERGFGKLDVQIDEAALDHWAVASDGDARRALNALEVAVLSGMGVPPGLSSENAESGRDARATVHVTLAVAEQSVQRKAVVYDATGDGHYDAASAFIKSMRGSDPDAALYWLAFMLEAGEDPRFIARRIAIFASEDVGMADPTAIQVAAACFDIVLRIGLPEGKLTLAQAVIHMATAPKSRSVADAIGAAAKDAAELRTVPVPPEIADAHYAGAAELGRGKNGGKARNASRPPGDLDDAEEDSKADSASFGVSATYYSPTDAGNEAAVKQRMREKGKPG